MEESYSRRKCVMIKEKHNKIQIQRYVDQAGVPFLLYETEEKEKS